MARLTDLLDLPHDQAEEMLCKLVTDKTVHAKIDRPAGIINFTPRKGADELLNEWSGDLGRMLSLIEKTGHLINKVGELGVSVDCRSDALLPGIRYSRSTIGHGLIMT